MPKRSSSTRSSGPIWKRFRYPTYSARQRTTITRICRQQTVALVTEGVYRYTRNPMYLGMLCFLLAWALWLSTPLALLGLALYVGYLNRFQIGPEERVLEERFGTRFTSYCATVRRWL